MSDSESGLVRPYVQSFPGYGSHVLEQLNVQRYLGAFTDVVVHVEDVTFKLHQCLLAAACPKFQSLLYNMRQECGTSLTIKDVPLSGFSSIMDYVYTGILKLDSSSAHVILSASQYLEMRDVEKAVLEYFENIGSDTPMPPTEAALSLMKMSQGVGLEKPVNPTIRGDQSNMAQHHSSYHATEALQSTNPKGLQSNPSAPDTSVQSNAVNSQMPAVSSHEPQTVMHAHANTPSQNLFHQPTTPPHAGGSPRISQSSSWGNQHASPGQATGPGQYPPNSGYPSGTHGDGNYFEDYLKLIESFQVQGNEGQYRQRQHQGMHYPPVKDISVQQKEDAAQHQASPYPESTPDLAKIKTDSYPDEGMSVAATKHNPTTAAEGGMSGISDDVAPDTAPLPQNLKQEVNTLPSDDEEGNFEAQPMESITDSEGDDGNELELTEKMMVHTPTQMENVDGRPDDLEPGEISQTMDESSKGIEMACQTIIPSFIRKMKKRERRRLRIQIKKRSLKSKKTNGNPMAAVQPGLLESDDDDTDSLPATSAIKSRPLKKRLKDDIPRVPKKRGRKPLNRGEKIFPCEKCGRKFKKMENLKKHLDQHANLPMFSCHICDQKYVRPTELTQHMREHTAETFMCHHCNKDYTDPRHFKKHMLGEHQEGKPFICNFPGCTFRSNRPSNVEKHGVIHSGVKTFSCPACGKSFAQPNGLQSHMKSCYQRRGYLCDFCGQKFNYLQSMKSHRLLHTGEKPYCCMDCGSRFADQRNYKRHRRIHDNAYPYGCTYCDKRFRHSNSLKAHLNIHLKHETPTSVMPVSVSRPAAKSHPLPSPSPAPSQSDMIPPNPTPSPRPPSHHSLSNAGSTSSLPTSVGAGSVAAAAAAAIAAGIGGSSTNAGPSTHTSHSPGSLAASMGMMASNLQHALPPLSFAGFHQLANQMPGLPGLPGLASMTSQASHSAAHSSVPVSSSAPLHTGLQQSSSVLPNVSPSMFPGYDELKSAVNYDMK